MSIRNRVFPYVMRVFRGNVRVGQLVDYTRNRFVPKTEVMSAKPTHLWFFITSRCNFRCDMCPTHSTKIPESYLHRHCEAPDMSLDLLRFVLDLFPNVIRVPLIGTGEPLLNPHLFDMVRECIRRKMIVDTVSNGYILDAYIPDFLRSGIDLLCISVNGHTAREFQRMTGNDEGHYSRILKNAEAMVRARGNKKARPRIELDFIIDSFNYGQMEDMIKIGEGIGADVVNFNGFVASPYPGFTPEERCLYADDPAVREELAGLMSKKYRCYVRWPYLLRPPKDKKSVCRWPFSILTVDGAGDVGGCPRAVLNSHKNGKVFDKNPWNNEFFKDLRKRHLQGDLLWPCESCVESCGVEPGQVIKSKYQRSSKSERI